jgi:hypothetical protein
MNCEHIDSFINSIPTSKLFDNLLINNQNEETNATLNQMSNAEQVFNFICHENRTNVSQNSKLVCKQCVESLSGQNNSGLICKTTNQLHICASCFFIGCFSLNSSSSSHMGMHSMKAHHFITIDLRYGAVYCFKCKDFQYNEYLERLRRISFTNSNYLPHSIQIVHVLIYKFNLFDHHLYFQQNFPNGSLRMRCSKY